MDNYFIKIFTIIPQEKINISKKDFKELGLKKVLISFYIIHK